MWLEALAWLWGPIAAIVGAWTVWRVRRTRSELRELRERIAALEAGPATAKRRRAA
jgi:hypothetical protein